MQDIHLCLVFTADLGGVLPQYLGLTAQGGHPPGKIPQPPQRPVSQQVGAILLQRFGKIAQLGVKPGFPVQFPPDGAHLMDKPFGIIRQNLLLQHRQAAFQLLQRRQGVMDLHRQQLRQ